AQNGIELEMTESTENVIAALNEKKTEADLEIEIKEPEISEKTLSSLGLSELISTGYSNFAGSPANRRHNIRVGASKFNGLLIKPGETFSFTTNLGEVDAANGYLPELVIKENTTTPEYGGGLCQVSTTTFRAALNGGLPIVARKAHSYPVSYYRPYGTDATIYIPNPDLKFTNDTGKYILIQTRATGNYLYFDFYGTKKDVSLKFAGNKNATGAVSLVENVTPHTYDFGGRGPGSFKAIFYRFIYDGTGKLLDSESFYSNYDSPDKYPH
ncbi:MAG: VanW family protein, partial [Patescibacteria group bacterium]|nr:VanW family protein [Patescibacteria group bacterium]